jgi:hypothetical protein
MPNAEGLVVVEKKKLYVGCALTLAPQEFKDDVEELKTELEAEWEVLKFLGTVAGTEVDVYQRDIIENVGGCDAFLGVADETSTGLGWEGSEACHLSKPTLFVAHVDTKLTRLILGAPHFNPTMTVRRYENMVEDVPVIAREVFANVLESSAVGN